MIPIGRKTPKLQANEIRMTSEERVIFLVQIYDLHRFSIAKMPLFYQASKGLHPIILLKTNKNDTRNMPFYGAVFSISKNK